MSQEPRADFTRWCRDELFTPEMVEATSLLQQALDVHLLQLFDRLGLAAHLKEPITPVELAARLGYVESAHITLEAVLDRLSSRGGFIRRESTGDGPTFVQVADAPEPGTTLEALAEKMDALGEEYSASLEFLHFGATVFEEALGDDPDLLDRILAGRESEHQELWFRATNTDPLQNVHGIMGAKAIDILFDRGRILELGGGTGNGIRNLFQLLAEKGELDRIEEYRFTDISQRFVMSTRHEIRADYPGVPTDWRFADINRPLEEQRIEPGSFDLIYAVNAAHVAKDLVGALESCRKTLVPGGRVLFAERVRLTPRDMAPRELALNLSVYHRTAAIRNPDYRPVHCYLSPANWLRALELAGFAEAEIWPDIEALAHEFPDQYAAVVTAVA